jgi:hypothetical protein
MHLFHSSVVIINQKLMIDRKDSAGSTTYNEKEDKCAQIGTDY